MLTNWNRDDARKLRNLLTARLGGVRRHYCHETRTLDSDGTHAAKAWTTLITFTVSLQSEDKSERRFETSFETSTIHSKPVVSAGFHRQSPHTRVYKSMPNCDTPELLPATIEDWVDKAVELFNEVDAEFEPRHAASVAKVKLEEEMARKRPNLYSLIEDEELTEVVLERYSYYCGDKRSCGTLEVVTKTNLGELKLEATLGSSGGVDELTVTLNGEEVNDDDMDGFDPGAPHYYGGSRAVSTWEENADENLQMALEKYLGLIVKLK